MTGASIFIPVFRRILDSENGCHIGGHTAKKWQSSRFLVGPVGRQGRDHITETRNKPVLVTFCYIMNHSKILWLTTITFYLTHDSMGQPFGLGSARWFSWVLLGLAACQLGSSVSEGQLAVGWGVRLTGPHLSSPRLARGS